jgi:hypothetical protein
MELIVVFFKTKGGLSSSVDHHAEVLPPQTLGEGQGPEGPLHQAP